MNTDDVALFDMDGSLADYNTALAEALEKLRSPGEPSITSENLWELEKQPHIGERMRLIKSQPGFWFNLKPLEAGMEIWSVCQRFGFQNVILTKGPKKHANAWDEKLRWCQYHLGENVDVHVVSNKSLVYGKLLYDDYPEYMAAWLKHRPRGLGIMPVTPSNETWQHPNVIKYRGLEDMERVMQAIIKVKERRAGEPLSLC